MILRARVLEGVTHGFATREGGVSSGAFASLNLGRATGDDPKAVAENHTRLAAAAGFDVARLVTPGAQVHGPVVVTLLAESSPRSLARSVAECDGIASALPGVPVGIRTADCVPVLLWDPEHGAVAAVHAGWRGIAAGIPLKGVQALAGRFGSDPRKLRVAIGPAIDACCYEVDAATAEKVREAAPGVRVTPSKSGNESGKAAHHMLDLRSAVRSVLEGAGVTAIESVGGCTSCEKGLFFSHRRDQGRTGRHLSWVQAP